MADDLIENLSRISKDSLNELSVDISCDPNVANEKLVMILNKNSGLAPYSHEFSKSNLDPQIISGFISAMTSFMAVMMGELQTQWKTEYGSELMLLVEHGAWAIGVLVVSRETADGRRRLRRVVHEFEDYFTVLKDSDGIEGSALHDFDEYVRRIFVNDQITGRTLVIKNPEWRRSLFAFDLPSTAFAVSKILLGFEEKQTIKEIAGFQDLSLEHAIDLVSKAYWNKAAFLKYIPPDDEILTLSERSSTILFQKDNPLRLSNVTLNVTARFDGRTSLSQLTEYVDSQDLEVLLDELGILINRGFLQRISLEQHRILLSESILSFLVSEGASIIGTKKMREIFETIRKMWGNRHPRIYRIMLTAKMRVHSIFDANMTTDDLDELANALEVFIQELSEHLSTICGKRAVEKLFLKMKSYQIGPQ
ncbi:MAG: hypothetical protein OEV85_02515 [Candidatus Thorarchaeota archaeon]|nr:hypothetical protein [Candidatus Thorarchaeota archaeon]